MHNNVFVISQPQFFSSFNSAEQLYDALYTWEKVGHLEVTCVSLKFWQQFDRKVKIGQYKKGSKTYKELTKAVHEWANKIVLQLAANTPEDYVLVECVDKNKGGPYGPRGMIRSLAAALGVYDAYYGLAPPNWGHPIPKLLENEDVFAFSDEVVDWENHDYDDGYRGVDPALYAHRVYSSDRYEGTPRYRYGY
jgi:Glycosyl hydrolases family 15